MGDVKDIQTEAGFRSFFDSRYMKVYRFFSSNVNHTDDAADLTQAVFVKFWESCNQKTNDISPDARLFTISKSILLDYFRAVTARQLLLSEYSKQRQILVDGDIDIGENRMKRILQCIEELPPRRREIFKMSKLQGLTYEEIASKLSISKNTVHVQISKALLSLRSKLAGWFL